MIAVSACLAGVSCKYDGGDNGIESLKQMAERKEAVLICPEVMGGLSVPRDPCERKGDRVCTRKGKDCTAEYRKGAEEALALLQKKGITVAVLKAKSPSCGKGCIYDGNFTRTLIPGNGVAAELLMNNGIRVLTETEWEKEKENSVL